MTGKKCEMNFKIPFYNTFPCSLKGQLRLRGAAKSSSTSGPTTKKGGGVVKAGPLRKKNFS